MTSNNSNSKFEQKDLRVLELIHASHNVSRKELAKRSGFSAASITAIVQWLIDEGFATELGKSRRPVSLSVRNDLAYVIGVENGCLETVASCAAIIRAVSGAIQQGVNSRVSELAHGDLERISVEMILQAARENDTLAFRVLHEAVSHIGVALADVVNLLNPHIVIFGGPLFRESSQLLLEPLKRVIRQCALEKSANELELRVSTLGSEAGALGAARLISEKVLESLYHEKAFAARRP